MSVKILDNKVIVITGASKGLGHAMCIEAAKQGGCRVLEYGKVEVIRSIVRKETSSKASAKSDDSLVQNVAASGPAAHYIRSGTENQKIFFSISLHNIIIGTFLFLNINFQTLFTSKNIL